MLRYATNVAVPSDLDIIAIRKAANLTQHELGERWGFNASTICRWEADPALLKPWAKDAYRALASKTEPEAAE